MDYVHALDNSSTWLGVFPRASELTWLAGLGLLRTTREKLISIAGNNELAMQSLYIIMHHCVLVTSSVRVILQHLFHDQPHWPRRLPSITLLVA